MTNTNYILAIVELAYFAPLVLLTLFFALRSIGSKNINGIISYIFLFIFLVLQIDSAAMIVSLGSNGTPSLVSLVIDSAATAALILASMSFYQFAKHFASDALPGVVRMGGSVVWDILTIGGVALGSYGVYVYFNAIANGDGASSSALAMFRFGFILMAIMWLILLLFILVDLRLLSQTRSLRPLYLGALVATLILGLKVGWLLYSCIDEDSAYGFTTTKSSIWIIFRFIPGALAMLVFAVVSVLSLRGFKDVKEQGMAKKKAAAIEGHEMPQYGGGNYTGGASAPQYAFQS